MDWSIQDVARLAGTTSRTLRHYDHIGLLSPSRHGPGGARYYDGPALVRLQRILLLRQLGLSLTAIADLLEGELSTVRALRSHLTWLTKERDRIDRLTRSVRTTLHNLENGEPLMATEILDGFDHSRYEAEVVQQWGREAWSSADAWWQSLSDSDKTTFHERHTDLTAGFAQARQAGEPAAGATAQALVQQHYDWLTTAWQGTAPDAVQYLELARMYTEDERFARTYDTYGAGTAQFVREAITVYVQRNLSD